MEKEINPFFTLLHAHDIIWEDKSWPLNVRMKATQILWEKALQAAKESHYGNVLTVETVDRLVERVSTKSAQVRQ